MKNQRFYFIMIKGIAVVVFVVSSLLHLIKDIYIPGLTMICGSFIMLFNFLHEKSTTNNKILKTVFAIIGVFCGFIVVMEIIGVIT